MQKVSEKETAEGVKSTHRLDSRPIKFRAWDNDKKEMFTPDYIDEFSNVCRSEPYMMVSGLGYIDEPIMVENAILMQFTGLHDRNGKEIYEGDQLKCEDLYVTVKWCDDMAGFDFESDEGRSIDFYTKNFVVEHYEIIGNIYENPELLTGI